MVASMKRFVAIALLGGCELVDGLTSTPVDFVDPCLQAGTVAAVAGIWNMGGSGSRDDCPASLDALETGAVVMKVPAFAVAQDTDGKLSATLPAPDGFTVVFSGSVHGTCVTAQLVETDLRGALPVLRTWTFNGDNADSVITGEFTVEGPDTCSGEGSFSASVR